MEHILPQELPEKGYESFRERDWKLLVHDLGNLCLTADNSALGNRPFSYKRELYRRGLEQERELAESDHWTPQKVAARRRRLVHFALGRWRLDGEQAIGTVDVAPEELDSEVEED